jgi:hypothetical protein
MSWYIDSAYQPPHPNNYNRQTGSRKSPRSIANLSNSITSLPSKYHTNTDNNEDISNVGRGPSRRALLQEVNILREELEVVRSEYEATALLLAAAQRESAAINKKKESSTDTADSDDGTGASPTGSKPFSRWSLEPREYFWEVISL